MERGTRERREWRGCGVSRKQSAPARLEAELAAGARVVGDARLAEAALQLLGGDLRGEDKEGRRVRAMARGKKGRGHAVVVEAHLSVGAGDAAKVLPHGVLGRGRVGRALAAALQGGAKGGEGRWRSGRCGGEMRAACCEGVGGWKRGDRLGSKKGA